MVSTDGIIGLFGRGLKTRILANALNVSIIFCIFFSLENINTLTHRCYLCACLNKMTNIFVSFAGYAIFGTVEVSPGKTTKGKGSCRIIL